MTNQPFFSIIIPTLNEEKNLPILLSSLAKQQERDFEVIISDSNSTDKTKNIAGEFKHSVPSLFFVDKKAKNVSAARNYGASLTKGRFLIFFDADVEISKDFLRKIKEDILIHHLDALTVWNRTKSNKITGKIILGLLNLSMTVFQKIKPAANGPCMIIKKEFFDKAKGFDDEIVFGEDFDLIQKVHKLKAKFAVFETPVLYVSTRRFEKEGFFFSLYKSFKAILYQLFFGPIKKPIFNYEMGGQYYEKKK
jgi:glycosyltransferase involved in cell wall biosynthesis